MYSILSLISFILSINVLFKTVSASERLNDVIKAMKNAPDASTRSKIFRDNYYWESFPYAVISSEMAIIRHYIQNQAKYNLNFNNYLEYTGFLSDFHHFYFNLIDMDFPIEFENLTPLMISIGFNKPDIVKLLVDATFTPKLDLLGSHLKSNNVTARSIARKLPYAERKKMLEILKFDKNKHEISSFNSVLHNDFEVTVREAVFANDVRMAEAALLLGNFGDKTDTSTIRRAMLNENVDLLELLVLEEYAIPEANDRPSYYRMDSYSVNKLLKYDDVTKREATGIDFPGLPFTFKKIK